MSGRSTIPKPKETSAQMAMQMLMIRTLAFQYSAGDLLPDMGVSLDSVVAHRAGLARWVP
jgi:hypothetical protein